MNSINYHGFFRCQEKTTGANNIIGFTQGKLKTIPNIDPKNQVNEYISGKLTHILKNHQCNLDIRGIKQQNRDHKKYKTTFYWNEIFQETDGTLTCKSEIKEFKISYES